MQKVLFFMVLYFASVRGFITAFGDVDLSPHIALFPTLCGPFRRRGIFFPFGHWLQCPEAMAVCLRRRYSRGKWSRSCKAPTVDAGNEHSHRYSGAMCSTCCHPITAGDRKFNF